MRFLLILNYLFVVQCFINAKYRINSWKRISRSVTSLNLVDKPVDYSMVIAFPDVGGQFIGMGQQMCQESPPAKKVYDVASKVLGFDLLQKCATCSKEELDNPLLSYPAVFTASMAAIEQLKQTQRKAVEACTVTMGISLGELTAQCFAGVLSLEDGVKAAQLRGRAVDYCSRSSGGVKSGMLSIEGFNRAQAEQLCNYAVKYTNEPIMVVMSLRDDRYILAGHYRTLEAAMGIAAQFANTKVYMLPCPIALHTAFASNAAMAFLNDLKPLTFNEPRIPVICNVNRRPLRDDGDEFRVTITQQMFNVVNWNAIVKTMSVDPTFDRGIAVGPFESTAEDNNYIRYFDLHSFNNNNNEHNDNKESDSGLMLPMK